MLASLPTHPLMVHIPVVLIPLTAIGALVVALRPRLLPSFGGLLVVLSGVGFVGTLLAASTGDELEEPFRAAGQTISPVLHDHAELGETTEVLALVFFLTTLIWVGVAWWRRRSAQRTSATPRPASVVVGILAALAVLGGAAATVGVVATGHNGAKSVWDQHAP